MFWEDGSSDEKTVRESQLRSLYPLTYVCLIWLPIVCFKQEENWCCDNGIIPDLPLAAGLTGANLWGQRSCFTQQRTLTIGIY